VSYREYRAKVANKVDTKLQSVLERNPGYSTLRKISDILCGNEQELSAKDVTLFKYSPVMSCNVERSFSRYKFPLSDNWRSLQFDNFQMVSLSTATLPKTKAEIGASFSLSLKVNIFLLL
jgi:hypothetical protein